MVMKPSIRFKFIQTHMDKEREKKNNVSNRLNENDDTGRNV